MHAPATPLPPIRAGVLIRAALATYRAQFPRVAGATLLVLVPLGLLQTIADHRLKITDDMPGGVIAALIVLAGMSALGGGLGAAFYTGLLDKLVGEHQHGHRRLSLGEVIRTLPYGRLLIANVLLLAITVVGAVLLVVPAVVEFTFFCLVGPLINIENHGVIGAFRRSAQLVRGHFWLVLRVVTLPIVGEQLLDDALHQLLHDQPPLVVALVLNGLLAATGGAIVGLIEVTLTTS